MYRILRIFLYIGCVVITANLLLTGCNRSEQNRTQGYIEGEFVYVASPYAGALETLHVQKGRNVKAGEPLFTLESVSEKAEKNRAQAALALSEKEFARQGRLIRTPGATSQQDFERARSSRDQDRERLTRAQWDLSQKSQPAPQAGLVFDTLYREGEWIAAGRPVVSLLPPKNIKVRAFVPEKQLGAIRPGGGVRVYVDGVREPFHGKVSFISPQAEYTPPVIFSRENRSKLVFMIEAIFDQKESLNLHPGQPVDVEFAAE